MLLAVAPSACSHRIAQRPPAPGRGAALYAADCESCHGASGGPARVGPTLAGERKRKDDAAILRAIEEPDPPMPKLYPGSLSARDVADIAAYVETL